MEKTITVEVLEKLIRKDMNEALKPMDLKVEKIEFVFDKRMLLTINFRSAGSNLYV
ncbi:hypothetical protein Cst_c22660 [Thermoclostridium stercorarium subsp. stercorarium DSM 8532]|jgi:hypothetical protein|uniref:Uncharacterized protein n=1 Tax=Thermoclostridium stercorarium (strain ATCC 35414 / DSM 8532 / NCIMB 11754) TaxID=1121335 RepID=L7VS87_THES1|nr:hypothetical protein [Thermoclostridium stercorarium]AGC69226.1 hypothetical protein Cst_c22660 [Thermoclostridium stercorarium subsp. stercorarium DSM 8532]AGI40197.1 hypothetical protein Clst_2171 [Thermoclostridium stercorarium subsp. stercorarium DSM 8532]UZQ85197.1 hypothetical protein ODU73_002312 [Thermoclostridium stercorarium]